MSPHSAHRSSRFRRPRFYVLQSDGTFKMNPNGDLVSYPNRALAGLHEGDRVKLVEAPAGASEGSLKKLAYGED
jgi:hypothetical protein